MSFRSALLLMVWCGFVNSHTSRSLSHKQSSGRFLRNEKKKNDSRTKYDPFKEIDIAEDVGFWTRILEGQSLPPTSPTQRPTGPPTKRPSREPTTNPTRKPSRRPTRQPSRKPTREPTSQPSRKPTKPTRSPTNQPTMIPSFKPTPSPVTSEPTPLPSPSPVTTDPTPPPTPSPVTSEPTPPPTPSPVTTEPTFPQTTSPVTPEPTELPTPSPVTPEPTELPTASPVTPEPSTLPTIAPTSPGAPTVSPSSAPSFPCNLTPEQRAIEIRQLMATVTDDALFDDPSTPQALALNWITNEDAIEPPLCPDKKMIQRYVLAAFYFATEGDNWDQCNAPEVFNDPASVAEANANCDRVVTPFQVNNDRIGDLSTDAWLSPVNECFWGGIACWGADTPNLELCIDQLDFGEFSFLIIKNSRVSCRTPFSTAHLTFSHLLLLCYLLHWSNCNNNKKMMV